MKFHYALVDDLLSREEFEERVEAKIEESGDLLDEETAAMLVVKECGRHHVRIRDLTARASLLSFFGKILECSPPREFVRSDGSHGMVASLQVGDESGRVRVVLWDEKAAAIDEIDVGEVLEIIGRPQQAHANGPIEVHALALRKAVCEIHLDGAAAAVAAAGNGIEDIEAYVLSKGEIREFCRRDGSAGEMQEAIVGGAFGTVRLVCWAPMLLATVEPGGSYRIRGAKRVSRAERFEYHLDELGRIEPLAADVEIPFARPGEIEEGRTYSVRGTLKTVEPMRSFTDRRGEQSFVRNAILDCQDGEVRLVFWGDMARDLLMPGESVEVHGALARKSRQGGLELSLQRGSVLVRCCREAEEIVFQGTVLATLYGTAIDDGREYYMLEGELPPGSEMRVRGLACQRRLQVLSSERIVLDRARLIARTRSFLDRL
ncbi:MAG: OB-fold nucleic acid binding domain-containing protein [Methanomicrobiales archaeon]|nr:OB-fold nucleic acid binding domain-containing protein [Methanomicrobiales archaeon]MDI6875328.1 OB-fold nucleic acid binding domain-containing protein [Methanomicrobiales archaeon]